MEPGGLAANSSIASGLMSMVVRTWTHRARSQSTLWNQQAL